MRCYLHAQVEVCLPNGTSTLGFLGLYDDDIAIVTSLGCLEVVPLDLDYKSVPVSSDDHVIAVGRVFSSYSLWALDGVPCTECSNTWVSSTSDTTKAVLGGPLIQNNVESKGRLLGMNLDLNHDDKRYTFLPLGSLKERLEHFQILNPKVIDFHNYSLPKGVSRIIPSGFMSVINQLKALGYPLPPPLVLELNGHLLNTFEGCFGESYAWKGYSPGCIPSVSKGFVWSRLTKNVLDKISRRVVSLASFNEGIRFFACTGLLIKLCGHTFILTSASLVRNDDEGDIDNNLKIEVFLPPNQRRSGKLEVYNLNYNIAIISVAKQFFRACAEDIFKTNPSSEKAYLQLISNEHMKSSQKVIAVGRDACEGLLMGTIGEVKPTNEDSKLNCEELRLSTCEINKAGIGGPLIDLGGRFVGMNFYDGRRVTPFLPKSKIVEVVTAADVLLEYFGYGLPHHIVPLDDGWPTKKNRWLVPPPYWYHGELDVDADDIPVFMGRQLQVGTSKY
ncbi:hypothetical protein PVAP13_2KG369800 [Panicum virgatum]|nr:hypothetical protein PVAP13_2KG369800 [Panicum virgatum]KAG2643984.1 hypothetical protein PVAP13_2KG369800 [Panicum virgatum]